MTEKELKKLNRYQLLELLIIQTERANKLQATLDEAKRRLEDQETNISYIIIELLVGFCLVKPTIQKKQIIYWFFHDYQSSSWTVYCSTWSGYLRNLY